MRQSDYKLEAGTFGSGAVCQTIADILNKPENKKYGRALMRFIHQYQRKMNKIEELTDRAFRSDIARLAYHEAVQRFKNRFSYHIYEDIGVASYVLNLMTFEYRKALKGK